MLWHGGVAGVVGGAAQASLAAPRRCGSVSAPGASVAHGSRPAGGVAGDAAEVASMDHGGVEGTAWSERGPDFFQPTLKSQVFGG